MRTGTRLSSIVACVLSFGCAGRPHVVKVSPMTFDISGSPELVAVVPKVVYVGGVFGRGLGDGVRQCTVQGGHDPAAVPRVTLHVTRSTGMVMVAGPAWTEQPVPVEVVCPAARGPGGSLSLSIQVPAR